MSEISLILKNKIAVLGISFTIIYLFYWLVPITKIGFTSFTSTSMQTFDFEAIQPWSAKIPHVADFKCAYISPIYSIGLACEANL